MIITPHGTNYAITSNTGVPLAIVSSYREAAVLVAGSSPLELEA